MFDGFFIVFAQFTKTWNGVYLELGFDQLSSQPSKFYNVSIYQCVHGLVDAPSIAASHNYTAIKVLFETCQRDE